MTEQFERSIEASGLPWTFLRPGMFAGNSRLWWAPQIRAAEAVRWPYLGVPTAPTWESWCSGRNSVVIGDSLSDALAGHRVGARSLLLGSGHQDNWNLFYQTSTTATGRSTCERPASKSGQLTPVAYVT